MENYKSKMPTILIHNTHYYLLFVFLVPLQHHQFRLLQKCEILMQNNNMNKYNKFIE